MEEDLIIEVLEKNNEKGLTITELVDNIALSRSQIRIVLAKLEGARKVRIRKAGMAKIYFSVKERENELFN